MIAKLVQRFDFKLDPNQSMKKKHEVTLKHADGCKCFLTVRS
jgi:hypothetical protein